MAHREHDVDRRARCLLFAAARRCVADPASGLTPDPRRRRQGTLLTVFSDDPLTITAAALALALVALVAAYLPAAPATRVSLLNGLRADEEPANRPLTGTFGAVVVAYCTGTR